MVQAKRNSKRAWRSIDASAEEAILAATPLPGGGKRQAASGGGGKALPDSALFFEDKVCVIGKESA